jgi:hypothetical protein
VFLSLALGLVVLRVSGGFFFGGEVKPSQSRICSHHVLFATAYPYL